MKHIHIPAPAWAIFALLSIIYFTSMKPALDKLPDPAEKPAQIIELEHKRTALEAKDILTKGETFKLNKYNELLDRFESRRAKNPPIKHQIREASLYLMMGLVVAGGLLLSKREKTVDEASLKKLSSAQLGVSLNEESLPSPLMNFSRHIAVKKADKVLFVTSPGLVMFALAFFSQGAIQLAVHILWPSTQMAVAYIGPIAFIAVGLYLLFLCHERTVFDLNNRILVKTALESHEGVSLVGCQIVEKSGQTNRGYRIKGYQLIGIGRGGERVLITQVSRKEVGYRYIALMELPLVV